MRAGLSVVFALCIGLSPTRVLAERRPGPEATAHAIAEIANCRKQAEEGRRTDGSTACPTETPVPTQRPTPTNTPMVVVPVEPTETPVRACWWTDPKLGDPDSGYIVFVPNDDDTDYVPVPVDCDATPTPTATDVPTDTPVAPPSPTPTPRPKPTTPVARAPQPAPTARVVYIRVPADTPTPLSPTDTPTPTPTRTATAVTPTRTPTLTATAVPTATAMVAVAAVRPPPPEEESILPRSISWTSLLVILGALAVASPSSYAVYRWQRRRYEAELAPLEAEP